MSSGSSFSIYPAVLTHEQSKQKMICFVCFITFQSTFYLHLHFRLWLFDSWFCVCACVYLALTYIIAYSIRMHLSPIWVTFCITIVVFFSFRQDPDLQGSTPQTLPASLRGNHRPIECMDCKPFIGSLGVGVGWGVDRTLCGVKLGEVTWNLIKLFKTFSNGWLQCCWIMNFFSK